MGDQEKEYVKLKLVRQNGRHINFRVKMSIQMRTLKKAYSKRVGSPVTSLRFIFNGRRINDDLTPLQLELENDDIIEVVEQTRGELRTRPRKLRSRVHHEVE